MKTNLTNLLGFSSLVMVSALCAIFWDSTNKLEVLFSGLAFVGVVWAVLMQREELQEQRKELELTRGVFEDQSLTSKKQRFENTFFQLLALHNQRSSAFRYNDLIGPQGFTSLLGKITAKALHSEATLSLIDAYDDITAKPEAQDFIPYINNLFNILEIIETTTLIDSDVEKRLYYKIVGNLLSSAEAQLLQCESKGRGKYEIFKSRGLFDNIIFGSPTDPDSLFASFH